MSQPIYKPVADGVYLNKGSLISVGKGQSLAISEKKPRMNIWVGKLPDNWRLCEVVEAPKADWSKAPAQAMWWCVDPDGDEAWHELEPQQYSRSWGSEGDCVVSDERIDIPLGVDWRTLKERRPQEAADGAQTSL